MALTPAEWRKGLSQEDLNMVKQIEKELDLALRNKPPESMRDCTFVLNLIGGMPNQRIQKELIRLYTNPQDGQPGWDSMRFSGAADAPIITLTASRVSL